jgi:hypothetical protein
MLFAPPPALAALDPGELLSLQQGLKRATET